MPSVSPASSKPLRGFWVETMFTVVCCNGHRITASETSIGLTRKCPACGVAVSIDPAITYAEEPLLAQPARSLSDTGAMRILMDGHESAVMLPTARETEPAVDRDCPRCGRLITLESVVCRHCQCYVGSMPDAMRNLQ